MTHFKEFQPFLHIAQEIFNQNDDVIVVQIRKLSDQLEIKKSTLETMADDKPLDNATVFFRSIHHEIQLERSLN